MKGCVSAWRLQSRSYGSPFWAQVRSIWRAYIRLLHLFFLLTIYTFTRGRGPGLLRFYLGGHGAYAPAANIFLSTDFCVVHFQTRWPCTRCMFIPPPSLHYIFSLFFSFLLFYYQRIHTYNDQYVSVSYLYNSIHGYTNGNVHAFGFITAETAVALLRNIKAPAAQGVPKLHPNISSSFFLFFHSCISRSLPLGAARTFQTKWPHHERVYMWQ